jgi:DNA-3-methyladenine glycosylase
VSESAAARLLAADPVAVAPRLLGCVVRSRGVAVRLTDVEAYRGVGVDPGSHAFRGPTDRTRPVFGPAGTLYVHLSYGMHRCVNLVCDVEGEAGAVLLRAVEVLEGHDLARERRAAARPARDRAAGSDALSFGPPFAHRDLARGPARLATVLGIELADSGGMLATGPITLEPHPPVPPEHIAAGPRVGVSGPGGGPEFPWRFWLAGEPTVSPYRPGRSAAR